MMTQTMDTGGRKHNKISQYNSDQKNTIKTQDIYIFMSLDNQQPISGAQCFTLGFLKQNTTELCLSQCEVSLKWLFHKVQVYSLATVNNKKAEHSAQNENMQATTYI